jgi:hypothetical protein
MPSNFFSKLVKNAQAPQTPTASSRTSSDEQRVTSPPTSTPSRNRPHSQTISHPPLTHFSPYGDSISSSSTGSVRIGVIPPSPCPTESDLSVHATGYKPSIEQVHQASLHHRRVRSQERHVLDRHEVSLAARPTGDITTLIDETELTPTPGRSSQAPEWLSSHSPDTPPRQLSPASSTGNLKGFVDKQGARTHSLQPPRNFVKEKSSKRSMRGTTQPPPPLNFESDSRDANDVQHQAGRHEDPFVPTPNIVVESPTALTSQKPQSLELLGALSDGDAKSIRSATSSSSKQKNIVRKPSGPRKTSGAASGAPMSRTPQVPPLPPLPASATGSGSTLSVNGTKPRGDPSRSTQTRTGQGTPMRSSPRTRSPNISLTRSDISDGDAFASSGDDSGSSSDELDLNEQDIPVTGFAVASNKRNADFHELFPNIPEGDYLIEGEIYLFCETLCSEPTTQIMVVRYSERF